MRLIVTGDRSRYQFFRHIIDAGATAGSDSFHTERIGERDIYITSDKSKLSDDTYFSDKIPLNTLIFFPKEYGDDLSIQCSLSDKLIVFDELPYGTDEDHKRLDRIIQSGGYGQLVVVLLRNDEAALDSDITNEEMALEQAEEEYKKKNINVNRYSIGDRPDFLFWSVDAHNANSINMLRSLIDKAHRNALTFGSCYELSYEIDGINDLAEDPKTLNSFCGYRSDMRGENVWDIFYARAYDFFFRKDNVIDEFCTGIYRSFVSELCIWDISADIADLKRSVRELFEQRVRMSGELIYRGDERGYQAFISYNMKVVLEFKNRITAFFKTDISRLLEERIRKDIERLEELIG